MALGLALAFGSGVPARADPAAQALTRTQTFVVQSMLDARRAEIGSGVVVGRDGDVLTLATAAHLVESSGALRILDTSRRAFYEVIGVRTVPGYDLALIRVRAQRDFPVQPVAIAPAIPGEPVWVWGNPRDSFWTLSTGTVLDDKASIPAKLSPRVTIDCAACSYGDSGSGVFSSDGKLIGILSAGWRDASGRVLFVEVEPAALISRELLAQR